MLLISDYIDDLLSQVVSGLLYLHGHGIMHRDLTLANLLLTRDMRVGCWMEAKLWCCWR